MIYAYYFLLLLLIFILFYFIQLYYYSNINLLPINIYAICIDGYINNTYNIITISYYKNKYKAESVCNKLNHKFNNNLDKNIYGYDSIYRDKQIKNYLYNTNSDINNKQFIPIGKINRNIGNFFIKEIILK